MYVIIGANGYLGAYFIKNILERTNESILAVDRYEGQSYGERVKWVKCDITNFAEVEKLNQQYLQTSDANKIVYLAAYHHPDLVEKNPRIAWNTNVTALSNFLNTADNVVSFFYPSTDSVYGESEDNHCFKETDALRPVNRYGVHKTVAEKLVTAYGHHVVRYPFLIAPSLLPERKHFYDVIAETIQSGEEFDMFADSYRSTLSFDTAARLTIELIEKGDGAPPVLNVCADKPMSKYEVGLLIADKVGVSRDLIKPISVNASNGIFEAKRASSTLMDNTLLKQVLGYQKITLEL